MPRKSKPPETPPEVKPSLSKPPSLLDTLGTDLATPKPVESRPAAPADEKPARRSKPSLADLPAADLPTADLPTADLPAADLPTADRSRAPSAEPSSAEAPVPAAKPRRAAKPGLWLSLVGWIVAAGMVALAFVIWQNPPAAPAAAEAPTLRPTFTPRPADQPPPEVDLPVLAPPAGSAAIVRRADPLTIIPTRPRTEVVVHKVDAGDAIFSIAETYNVTPETVLWANYELLNDNPDFLELGMELNIPPVDGVYYLWQEGDTLESVAAEFEAEIDEILEFSGNQLDLANPVIEPGEYVMLPGAHREFRQWLIPTIARGNAGVNSGALGPGACSGSYTGPVGSGAFIWPSNNHTLSGNDYWSGHLAIDIGAVQGDSVFSSDAGVVVFSGWANGGYGYTVVVDHGNGYQTLYAHLSGVSRPCGAGVSAGSVVGSAGSTGNSTGTHLHFEVRLNGGFINPWFVLPPP